MDIEVARVARVADNADDAEVSDHGPSAMFPGTVDVRLLTSSPRLDGLSEDSRRTGLGGR